MCVVCRLVVVFLISVVFVCLKFYGACCVWSVFVFSVFVCSVLCVCNPLVVCRVCVGVCRVCSVSL